ncbi:helix-turn-helix transcriptional regulator [Cryobacterium roopkundense]|uniref:Putative ArsR family transcriptional regulator n=1 Tax=Cryobacterium roopkundense TaxID=1001240 RepID=A0A7W8ZYI6_9MICO|nr:ArsR family transcriptional regulator [Cryobacterium roopkundense]MBB5642584.1 putative ArsR family transcriptional regulator [Cryobacterium roopkundense]
MTAHPPGFKTLASLSRITLLNQLQRRGTMTIGDLAEATGLHQNTTREHLDRLVHDGFVTCEPERRDIKGRPRMLYSAAEGVDRAEGSIRGRKVEAALQRAEQVRRMLPPATPTSAHGHEPASAALTPVQRQLDALDDHLDQSGFDASVDPGGLQVHLRDCPYSEMVKSNPEVCRVHFTLIQGVLDQAEGPLRARQLHLVQAPQNCTLDLQHCGTKTEAGTEPEQNIIHGVLSL